MYDLLTFLHSSPYALVLIMMIMTTTTTTIQVPLPQDSTALACMYR